MNGEKLVNGGGLSEGEKLNSILQQQQAAAIKNSKEVVCECGSIYFEQKIKMFKPPVFLTANKGVFMVPAFICSNCKKEINPNEI